MPAHRPPLRPSFLTITGVRPTSSSLPSVDGGENPFDVVALNGASAALAVSPIPFNGPVGGVKLALKKGEWIPFPTESDLDESVFELVVAGRRNAQGEIDIMMVEAGATPNGLRLLDDGDPPSDEAAVSAALEEAKPYIAGVIDLIAELASKVEKPHIEWPRAVDYTPELAERVAQAARPKLTDVIRIPGKQERNDAADRAFEEVRLSSASAKTMPRPRSRPPGRSRPSSRR